MYIGEALYSKLTGDGDVSALVGTRIYPNVIPQDADLPALAFQQISRPGDMAHDGPYGVVFPRFQITAQANTYDEVADLINKVRIAIDGTTGLWGGTAGVTVEGTFVKNIQDGYEFATERETKRLDVIIGHQE
jgi:hypothetical protein